MASNSKFHITRIVKTFAIKINKKLRKKFKVLVKELQDFGFENTNYYFLHIK
jgi:uncharacterized protein YggL (DUF469 family)